MQSLATSKGPCPNILGSFIGDFGTLVIHAPGDVWFYLAENWQPQTGFTRQQFIKMFHMAPPSNVPIGWWGVVRGMTDNVTCRDRNWFKGELQAALDMFLTDRGEEYIKPGGTSVDMLSKGRMLARKRKFDSLIVPAPHTPIIHRPGLVTSR